MCCPFECTEDVGFFIIRKCWGNISFDPGSIIGKTSGQAAYHVGGVSGVFFACKYKANRKIFYWEEKGFVLFRRFSSFVFSYR